MSLSYETALKLKEAGFPLKEVPDPILGGPFYKDDGEDRIYHYPTLSELIQECGDEFTGLYETPMFKDSNGDLKKWTAHSRQHTSMGIGDTPEEAVANLYIALHTP